MKKKWFSRCLIKYRHRKMLRIMKLTLMFLSFTICAAAMDSYSQNRKLDLKMENATIIDIFKEIERTTEFGFFFKHDQIDLDKRITVHMENKDIEQVLQEILGNRYNYRFLANNIMISLKPEESIAMQQQRNVQGQVTDNKKQPLPGVTVVLKGTNRGTVTDTGGNYTLADVPSDGVLVFSFVGMKAMEVPVAGDSRINVVMEDETIGIDEVVVTSFGIEKAKKSLGYSITEVSGDEFTEAREINVANALVGKVAGVSVSNVATGASGSSHVIIRGNTSLSAGNQPLYVIDGIPIDNSQMGSPGTWGGADWGDGTSSLNPDNIESMSILKGNSAAALYGSRASNGVILITTKKGQKREGLGIEFSTNYVLEDMVDYAHYQKQYGQGYNGAKPVSQSEAMDYGLYSYGAKLDGSSVIQFDGVSRPYSYVGNNRERFYRTGGTWTNTLSLSGGSDVHTYRFTIGDLENQDIVPNSNMYRRSLDLNVDGKYGKRLNASAKISYVKQHIGNRTKIMDSPGNVNYPVFSLPPSIDVRTLKGTTGKPGANEEGTELEFNGNQYVTNPYWTAYQFKHGTDLNRVIASVLLKYSFTDWLYLQGRVGRDWTHRFSNELEPYGTAFRPLGALHENRHVISETNADIMLGWDHDFSDVGFNGFVGGNYMRHNYDHAGLGGENFNIPFFHDVTNLSNQSYSTGISKYGVNSLFGSAEVSFKNYLFLNLTARQDWFSTLDGKHVLYPSASLGWVFSDTFTMPDWMTFGKLRLSWAEVGGGVDSPYQTALSYSLLGDGHQGQPGGRISQSTVPNTNLKPFKSTEYEIGTDVRFFNNRLGVDLTLYSKKTENDILSSSISRASGYPTARVNVGEITNKGVELLVNMGIIRHRDFEWNASFNYAYNKNKVISLAEGITTLTMEQSRTQNTYLANIVGLPYSQIYGYKFRTNDKGQRIYDSAGLPLQSNELYPLGSGICPTTMGLSNSLKYKNFYLNILIDMRTGGHIYVASDAYGYTRGFHQNTVEGRESGMDISGVDESGAAFTYHFTPENVQNYYRRIFNISEEFVENASFIKFRELTFGYNLPARLLNRTPFADVTLSLVGRNLFLLWHKTTNIDPESTYLSGNAQGLEGFGVPPTRSFGLNLSVKF